MTAATAADLQVLSGNWQQRARCLVGDYDPDLWHPTSEDHAGVGKNICFLECPVIAECRLWAFLKREDQGTWGGMDEWQRKPILRDLKRADREKRRGELLSRRHVAVAG